MLYTCLDNGLQWLFYNCILFSAGPRSKPSASEPAASLEAALVLCAKCDGHFPMEDTVSAGRVGRNCKLCFNACRALCDWLKKRNRSAEWSKMPLAKKKKLIKENRCVAKRGQNAMWSWTKKLLFKIVLVSKGSATTQTKQSCVFAFWHFVWVQCISHWSSLQCDY